MRLLLDTHLLLWASVKSERIPDVTARRLESDSVDLFFSAASIWEIAIKYARGKPDFLIEPGMFRRTLIDNGYTELPVTGAHAAYTAGLPLLHKDPFDRLLVAQAALEGVTLLTVDETLRRYPGPIEGLG